MSPCNYEEVHNFVGRKFGQKTLYAAFRRSSSPRLADPSLLPLSLSLLLLFFVYPLHANVHRPRGCAHQTFLLISWSRTHGANFPLSGWGERENGGRNKATIVGESHIRPYSRNSVLFSFRPQISDVGFSTRAEYFHRSLQF